MATRSTRKSIARSHTTPLVVPSDAPAWVTPDMIEKTLKVWQPYYEEELIPEDALAIIMGVGRILEFLAEGHSDETIRRPGSRQQP
ncbi:MAG: hypothetical protein CMJ46_00120 [Planctomyces sp.]|nr:hypothetical protein [Planctomyces sp.]